MSVYYNESDPFAARWLRRLIRRGHIAHGIVDSRPIETVRPSELHGFTQIHLFAGIGGWPYALRLAGWSDSKPVWTGSCPCQPFSSAGKRRGSEDERHLWPVVARLIREHRPRVFFGEQVSSKDGLAWFDAVQTDLEGEGYAVGAIDTCAASVGAPHRRQRLFFVGHADGDRAGEHPRKLLGDEAQHEERGANGGDGAERAGAVGGVGDSNSAREGARSRTSRGKIAESHRGGATCGVDGSNEDGRSELSAPRVHTQGELGDDAPRRSTSGFWADCDWVSCNDPGGPRWRPTEPGTFPLAHGVPERVGRLRGYGNAIVPQVAAAFVGAYLDGVAS